MSASPARTTAVATVVFLAIASVWLLCWYAVDLLLLIFAGVLFGVFLRTLAQRAEEWTRLPHPWSLALVVLTCLVVAVGASWLLLASIAGQFDQLATALPRAFEQLSELASRQPWGRWVARFPVPGDLPWEALVWRNGVLPATLGTTMAAVSGILVVLFVGLYFAARPEVYRRGLLHLIPLGARPRVDLVLDELATTLRWWLAGQALAMVAVGLLTVCGLWLLGVELALALGVLAGLLAFVPYIGPILSFVPAALIALLTSPSMVLWVAALYLGIQAVESYVLTPNIHRKSVAVPPILTLGAQLVLGTLVGTLGLLLATPLVAISIPLARALYVEDVIGEEPVPRERGKTESSPTASVGEGTPARFWSS